MVMAEVATPTRTLWWLWRSERGGSLRTV